MKKPMDKISTTELARMMDITPQWLREKLHDYDEATHAGLSFKFPILLTKEQVSAFQVWFLQRLINKYRLHDAASKVR